MSWASVILAGLKLVLSLLNWAQAKNLMQAGEDAAIARATLEVLEATNEGKRLRELIASNSKEQADDLWNRMLDATD